MGDRKRRRDFDGNRQANKRRAVTSTTTTPNNGAIAGYLLDLPIYLSDVPTFLEMAHTLLESNQLPSDYVLYVEVIRNYLMFLYLVHLSAFDDD